MFFKKAVSLAAALAAASAMCIAVSAEDYGQAGVVFMIKDEWEHRNEVGLPPYNETEDNVVTCQLKDVNITGNGDYTVEFSGWCVPDDSREYVEVGTLGLDNNIDMEANPDCVVTINSCTIDGVEYTVDEQPDYEENGSSNHILKLKNAYGPYASTTPEMDVKPWNTTDPIVINFTVSGLAEDKIEDNPDEVITTDYEEEVEETAESEEETAAAESEAEVQAAQAEVKSDSSESEDGSSVNPVPIVAAAAGVVIVATAVTAVLIVRKKK